MHTTTSAEKNIYAVGHDGEIKQISALQGAEGIHSVHDDEDSAETAQLMLMYERWCKRHGVPPIPLQSSAALGSR